MRETDGESERERERQGRDKQIKEAGSVRKRERKRECVREKGCAWLLQVSVPSG